MSRGSSAKPLSLNTRCAITAGALLLLVAGPLPWASDDPGVVRLSEPVEVTDTHETFGAAMPDTVDPITLSRLVENHANYEGLSVVVDARVSKICRKKGCFFIAQDGATTVRVTFKDYGFFVPTNISGRHVTLVGKLKRVELTEEQAAHFKSDLGSADVDIAPGPQFEIVATAVRVPRN